MSKLKFKLKPLQNYHHPFQVTSVELKNGDEPDTKNAVITLVSTSEELKESNFLINVSLQKHEYESNLEFNIANALFMCLPHHWIAERKGVLVLPVEDSERCLQLVQTAMDTLAQDVSYESILKTHDMSRLFSFLLSFVFSTEYDANIVQSEVILASHILQNADAVVYNYDNYCKLNLSQTLKEELNYMFWSALGIMTRNNAIVFCDLSKGLDFSSLAHAKTDLTMENLLQSVECSLSYFDKTSVKREVNALVQHNQFTLSDHKLLIKNLLLVSQQRGSVNMHGMMQFKNTISILYRAYLVFVEKNTDEAQIPELNAVLDQTLIKFSLAQEATLTFKVLKDLFTVSKLPLNNQGNHDVEIIFSEEIINMIKSLALKS